MKAKKKINKRQLTTESKDLLIIIVVVVTVFIMSYFFNIFEFLVRFIQNNPKAIIYVDEVITALVTLSISLAIFAWRRLIELKKETAKRIRLQEELTNIANTKAMTEEIISRQLRVEIEERKQMGLK